MASYRIVALDGGGIRGLLSLVVIQRLEQACPGWLASADLLAGTSTGGIIALGLAHGVPLDELRALYEQRGAQIFNDSWIDNALDLGNTVGAQYSNRELKRELRRIFGETRLGDLSRRVLIPAFDLDNGHADPALRGWSPKFFHNIAGPDSDGDRLAWQVALYTSAAPTYFPSVDGFIDGGVVTNNPSMAALAQAQDHRSLIPPPSPGEIALLSLGTGTSLMRIERKTLDWGRAQWVSPLLSIMLDGVMGVADYQCRQMLGGRYHRLAPVFPPEQVIGLDAVDRIADLVAFAEALDLRPTIEWLESTW